jgi:hypothetical protein
VGKAISVVASYTDLHGTAESVASKATALVVNVNDAPTGSVSITGTPTQGQILTAGNSLADADGLGTVSYQWLANGSNISGATNNTLTLTQAHVGKAISVKASYTDLLGTSESVTSAATGSVANVNDAPTVANAIADKNATQDVAFSFVVPSNTFADIDSGDTLTYALTRADGSALPSWLRFTASTRTLAGTPGSADPGTLNLKVTANDAGASVSTAFTLTVANVNDAPTVANAVADQAATEGAAFTFTVPSNTFADLDSADTLSYTATRADGSALPSWLQFNPDTRNFAGIPGDWDSGELNLRLTATDLAGASVNSAFKVTVGGSASPIREWTRLLGSAAADASNAMTTGLDGSIYVSGSTSGSLDGQTNNGGGSDAFITKFAADGTKQWTRLLGTSANDYARAMTTATDGSIYVSGSTNGPLNGQANSGASDAFIAKFNPDGTRQWTRLLGTSANDRALAMASGSDGAVYVGGSTQGSLDGQTNSGSEDAFITKFNSDGTAEWTQLLGTSAWDSATALATGSDGSIYVSGYTGGSLDGQTNSGQVDAYLAKFDSGGNKVWTQLLGSDAEDRATAVAAVADGSVYVSGYTTGDVDGQTNSGDSDAFVTRFDSEGNWAWTRLLSPTTG